MLSLPQALELHQAGKLAEAETAYGALLAARGEDADVLHLLGAALLQQKRRAEAVDTFRRCVAQRPGFPEAWSNLGLALKELGRLDEAAAAYGQAVTVLPGFANAHNSLGGVLRSLGRLAEAGQAFRNAMAAQPDHPWAWCGLANVLADGGQLDQALALCGQIQGERPQNAEIQFEIGVFLWQRGQAAGAEAAFRRAIAINPHHARALASLGVALKDQNRLDEAVQAYEQALAANPNYPTAWVWLGNALSALGRPEQGLAAYDRAVGLNGGDSDCHNQAGLALLALGRQAEAIVRLRHAVAADGSNVAALNNLGLALSAAGAFEPALAVYARALEIKPDFFGGLLNYGNELGKAGRREEAIQIYRRALALEPDNMQALASLVSERRHVCDWDGIEDEEARVRHGVAAGQSGCEPFNFLAVEADAADQQQCSRSWTKKRLGVVPRLEALPAQPAGDGRIRLGYLSSDLHSHATAYLAAELFERHDRSAFHVSAYSYGPDEDSPLRRRLVAGFDNFVDLRGASYGDAARRIQADGIHVLVDLKGYTYTARPQILAARPAPIQVNYLGYPGTMGAGFMDYVLADAFVVPMDQQPFYDEKIVHLPYCYQCNDTRRLIAEPGPSRAEMGLPERAFVFCCFNNTYKITAPLFGLWMGLLKELDGSVLWLLQANAAVRHNLRREASRHGIDPDRLVFAPRVKLPEHLARHRLADLFLDTLPYNAHTTASDALWAGLPVLTCAGSTFPARVAGSLLQAVGLPELITHSLDQYRDLALHLARQPAELTALRRRLEREREGSPLFDAAGFTRAMEDAYRHMVARHQAGKPPEAFAVPR